MDLQQIIFQFLGGLGIFLFGLKYMGDGLQRSAGDNLREILNRFTATPFRAVIAGIVVTVLLQSSSGTTVLAVGLVSAGFMKLEQAIGVIMGANIGTTFTAFIIGLNISAYALPVIAVGAFFLFFFKRPMVNSIGQVIFGFGCLFYGLSMMGDGLYPLREMPFFTDLMLRISGNPILGVGVGALVTFAFQSSTATTSIVQQLYGQGAMTLGAAVPILFGSNIGTTFTAVIAGIGASVAAKRTAAAHVFFNILGTIIILLMFSPFMSLLTWLAAALNLNPEMQVAFAHGLFNVINVGVQIWFVKQIAQLVSKIVPGEDAIIEYDASHLDYSIIQTSPSVALNQAKLEINQMGEFVMEEYKSMFKYYLNQDDKSHMKSMQLEDVVNQIDIQLTEYLMMISKENLPAQGSVEHAQLMDVTKYLERIGDHTQNILKNIEEAISVNKRHQKKNGNDEKDHEKVFYDEELVELFNLVEKNIDNAIKSFMENSSRLAKEVLDGEDRVNQLEMDIRRNYINRINKGSGLPSDGILFVDIVSNLERMSDHSSKIAKHSLGIRYPFQKDTRAPKKLKRKVEVETSAT